MEMEPTMAMWLAETNRIKQKEERTVREEFFLALTLEFYRAEEARAPKKYLCWLLTQVELYLSGDQDQAMANVLTAAAKRKGRRKDGDLRGTELWYEDNTARPTAELPTGALDGMTSEKKELKARTEMSERCVCCARVANASEDRAAKEACLELTQEIMMAINDGGTYSAMTVLKALATAAAAEIAQVSLMRNCNTLTPEDKIERLAGYLHTSAKELAKKLILTPEAAARADALQPGNKNAN